MYFTGCWATEKTEQTLIQPKTRSVPAVHKNTWINQLNITLITFWLILILCLNVTAYIFGAFATKGRDFSSVSQPWRSFEILEPLNKRDNLVHAARWENIRLCIHSPLRKLEDMSLVLTLFCFFFLIGLEWKVVISVISVKIWEKTWHLSL